MKLLTTILLLSCFSFLYAQMVVDKTPWFPPYNLTSITFANDSVGWMTSDEDWLFKSTDGGLSWSEFSKIPHINKIFAFSSLKLIGTFNYYSSPKKCFSSEDGGITWTEIIAPQQSKIESFFPISFNTLIASGNLKSIFKSTDKGYTWQTLSYDTSSNQIFDQIYFLDSLDGWITCKGEIPGIFRTIDGGISWFKIGDFLASDFQFVDSLNGYSGGYDILFSTTDGGANWFEKGTPYKGYLNKVKVSKDNKIFLSQGNTVSHFGYPSILVSTDKGNNWLSTNYSEGNFKINDFYIFDNGKVIACGEKGYITIMKDWLSFIPVNGEYIYKVYSFPDRVYVLTKNFILKGTENGNHWESFYNGLDNTENSKMFFIDTLDGFLIGTKYFWRTTDGGKNWKHINVNFSSKDGVTSGNSVYVFSADSLYKSDNLGLNWSAINVPNILKIYFFDSLVGWFYTNESNSSLYKTINGGITWEKISEVPLFISYQFFTADSGLGFGNGAFYFTNDGGYSWNKLKDNVQDFSYMEQIHLNSPGNYIALNKDHYSAGDETLLDYYLYNVENYSFQQLLFFQGKDRSNFHFYDGSHGWLAAGRKLYQILYNPTVDVNDKITKVPAEFQLFQNYPNPFNASTRIKYSIAATGKVTVQIFDILGRKVQVLLSEEKTPGTYEIDFNGANLTSGIYICKISSGALNMTRKIVLLK